MKDVNHHLFGSLTTNYETPLCLVNFPFKVNKNLEISWYFLKSLKE